MGRRLNRAVAAWAFGLLVILPALGADDHAIEQRLESIYAELPALEGVTVKVSSGVVKLAGQVLEPGDREQAQALAKELEGVVAVDDRIREVRDVRRRLRPVLEHVEGRLIEMVAAVPLLVVSALVFLAFYLFAGWLAGRQRLFRRLTNPFLRRLVRQVVQGMVLVLGILLALEILGATALVGAVLGTAGVFGLAVSFAFRDLVENYLAGVLLSLKQPFSPGDLIEIDGREGKVIRLTSRATILRTLDGNHLRIPNAQVYKGVILNYDRNPQRRFSIPLGIGPGDDPGRALELGLELLGETPGVILDPPPSAFLTAVGASTLDLTFYAWVDQRVSSLGKVKGEAIRLLVSRFAAEGIELPEPTYRVVQSTSAAPESAPSDPGAIDTSADHFLDEQIAQERRSEGDLLLEGGDSE